jgi:hypothetical protein
MLDLFCLVWYSALFLVLISLGHFLSLYTILIKGIYIGNEKSNIYTRPSLREGICHILEMHVNCPNIQD